MAMPLNPRPAQMLCLAMRIVRRRDVHRFCTRSIASTSTMTSAASAVMPPPCAASATPTFAIDNAGASLIPSPTIITLLPSA